MPDTTFKPRDRSSHSTCLYPPYKSTPLRGPTKPLIPLKQTLSEFTGPVYGHESVGKLDADLKRNARIRTSLFPCIEFTALAHVVMTTSALCLDSAMTSTIVAASRLPVRRGLGEVEAATYLSLSASFFRKLVEQGVMPRPRIAGGRRIWDVEELDMAFKALPREGGEDTMFNADGQDGSWADFR